MKIREQISVSFVSDPSYPLRIVITDDRGFSASIMMDRIAYDTFCHYMRILYLEKDNPYSFCVAVDRDARSQSEKDTEDILETLAEIKEELRRVRIGY